MWNYGYSFPTLCVLAIFFVFHITRPMLGLRSKRLFIYLLFVEQFIIIVDLVATMLDENYMFYPVALLYVVNMIFFLLFLLRIYLFYQFLISILNLRHNDHKALAAAVSSVFIISGIIVLSSFFTGWVFSIDQAGYHNGPMYNVLYIAAFFYLVLSYFLLFRNWKRISNMYRFGCFAYLSVLFIAYITRYMLPKVLVMDMFCMFAIIIIYLAFENPEYYLDSLTKLFNRSSLSLYIDEITGFYDYRIVSFAIKGFQESRDMYGWQQMDQGLVVISNFLKDSFLKEELFYIRNGRFVIVSKTGLNAEEACSLIRGRFEKPWKADNTELFLNVEFAVYDSVLGADYERVISSLLNALNNTAQKDNKGDIVYVSERSLKAIDNQAAVHNALERALEKNSVEVYLQPVVDAKTYDIIGAEALARINDPEMGIIMPDDFVKLAEMNGSIGLLGRQVFEKVCRFIKEYNDNMDIHWINVNLSPIQCMNKKLPNEYLEILNKYEIPSSILHFEITEQSIIDSIVLESQMHTMTGYGFQFALDDYGSGYSNALSVVSYPFENIKIDREIVRSYFDNPNSFLPNEIKIFLDMDFNVTAEGVETKEMADALRDFGCTYLQGYYFARPMPMEEFVERYSKVNA